MSELLDALREDPGATFEIEIDLPSGNRVKGTIGPLLDGKVCSQVCFEQNPPTDEDVKTVVHAMNTVMEAEPDLLQVTTTKEEYNLALKNVRRFMGGGVG